MSPALVVVVEVTVTAVAVMQTDKGHHIHGDAIKRSDGGTRTGTGTQGLAATEYSTEYCILYVVQKNVSNDFSEGL
jgi:hypothetical protein